MIKHKPVFIAGHPRPKGSWTPVKTKYGIKLRPSSHATAVWCKYAKEEIKKIWKHPIIEGPVRLDLTFFLPKPKTIDREYPTGSYEGDGDKLDRGVWDALTGTVYKDDCQVVEWSGVKKYSKKIGVSIKVTVLDEYQSRYI